MRIFRLFALLAQFLEERCAFLKEKLYNIYASRAFLNIFLSIMPNFCKFLKNRLQKSELGDIIMCGLKSVFDEFYHLFCYITERRKYYAL